MSSIEPELDDLARRLRHLLRHERFRFAVPGALESATARRLIELGAPAVEPLKARWSAMDTTELPPALLEAMAAVTAPPRPEPRRWAAFEGPALDPSPRSRATLRHWVRRLAYLADEEEYLQRAPLRMSSSPAFQHTRRADTRWLVELAETLPAGPERAALMWLLRTVFLREPTAADERVVAVLRESLSSAPPPPLPPPSRVNLPEETRRSPELAVLLHACHGGAWAWADVRADLAARGPLDPAALERAKVELERRAFIAPVPADGGGDAAVATFEGSVFDSLARHFDWPFGPGEAETHEPESAGEPARVVAAVHQRLWRSGPVEPAVQLLLALARNRSPASRRELWEGLLRRLEPPGGSAIGERPAGPGGALLTDAQWSELLHLGRTDRDKQARAAADRLAAAISKGAGA